MTPPDTKLRDVIQSIFSCEGVEKIYKDNKLQCTMAHVYDDEEKSVDLCFMAIAMPKRRIKPGEKLFFSPESELNHSACVDIMSFLIGPLEKMILDAIPKLSIVKKDDKLG
jgi:hypothetical protein